MVFLVRYLRKPTQVSPPNCSTLSPNNFTHLLKHFKLQGIGLATNDVRVTSFPPISTENKGLREVAVTGAVLKLQSIFYMK